MLRRTLFWKLLVSLVGLTLALSWIQANAGLGPITGFLVLVAMATVTSVLLARYLARPLDRMRRAALAQAAGEQHVEWPIPTTREMRALSNAVQTMALNLQDKVRTIEDLLAEQRAIFDGMAEGVIVVDPRERLLDANRAAMQMLAIDLDTARGRDVLELIRNARLGELIRETLRGERAVVEGDMQLLAGRERNLQVHGSALRTAAGVKGALIVLTDVTRLRQLERLQREFVANASHELKTPVTSIKGFAETLAGEDMDPEQARRFTRIILRQADQLGTLIDDLLELTRLEHESGLTAIERSELVAAELLAGVIESCSAEANQKNIQMHARPAEGLRLRAHPVLIQRALVNLLDNAIKYSPPHTAVEVRAESVPGAVCLSVTDQGPGIAPEHQGRIFERFYRVDKSRSRKLGGTGLGLSIVKHVMEAHGGSVSVQSAIGQGSTFTLRLPA
ncbi:MAG TPA: ATP-binding protein [Kiritimatiellia bacterium]|nr:ATP-binding protein [Kiritimatiellia bacterium]